MTTLDPTQDSGPNDVAAETSLEDELFPLIPDQHLLVLGAIAYWSGLLEENTFDVVRFGVEASGSDRKLAPGAGFSTILRTGDQEFSSEYWRLDKYGSMFRSLVEPARTAMDARNAALHGVWQSDHTGVKRRNRRRKGEEVATVSLADLESVARSLAEVVEEMNLLWIMVPFSNSASSTGDGK